MHLRNLWRKHEGRTIYIVGTSPSMRVFPKQFLWDKITIGLNQAYHYGNYTYGITIHPYVIPLERHEWSCKWITKVKPQDHSYNDHINRNNYEYMYTFTNADNPAVVVPHATETLYCGRGIQTSALHLAGYLGASCAILVGVGMAELGGEHHGHEQHTEFHGIQPKDVYKEYYYFSVKTRQLMRDVFNMQVLSLSPFLGDIYAEEDYSRLKHELGLPEIAPSKEVEYAKRNAPLIKDYI